MNFAILSVYFVILTCSLTAAKTVVVKRLNYSTCSPPVRQRTGEKTIQQGTNVTHGHCPWHTAIFRSVDAENTKYICGGILISKESVLTAAHCVHDEISLHKLAARMFTVRFDVTNRVLMNGVAHLVHNIKVHPNYFEPTMRHDIAILKLQTEVTFTDYVRPACLTNENFNFVDVVGNMVGFGTGIELYQAGMPGRSFDDCKINNEKFYNHYVNPDYNFCAGYVNGTTISKGDSGGGLVFKHSNILYVRGIASVASASSSGIIDITKYAVFTDIQPHYDWIVSEMDKSELNEATLCSAPNGPPINSIKGYYPWHVAIYNDEEIAAGTIISPDIILTESSVTKLKNLIVETNGRKFYVKDFKTYGDGGAVTISLLKLNETITNNVFTKMACFTKRNDDYLDLSLWIPSYTKNDNGLNIKDVEILKSNYFNYFGANSSVENAVSFINKGSGLVVGFNDGYYLRGITTYPYSYSGGVTILDISPFYDWISETIQYFYFVY